MKTLLFAFSLLVAAGAQASTLRCESQKNESLYFSDGQLVLTAEVASTTLLAKSKLEFLPVDKLGTSNTDSKGMIKNGYVRFDIGADAWCNYRLALPANFIERKRSFTGFVDAYCEENSNSSIRLSCTLW